MNSSDRCLSLTAFAVMVQLIPATHAHAQQPHPMQPRAIADSTFAAALAINDLATEIRRGSISPRTQEDPTLRLAVEQLAAVGAARKRPEFLRNEPLWDFAFDSLTFEARPNVQQRLIVTARARFARDAASAERITFELRRNGTEWRIVGHGRLREYLVETFEKAKGGALK